MKKVQAPFLDAKLAVGSRVYNSFFDVLMLKVLNCTYAKVFLRIFAADLLQSWLQGAVIIRVRCRSRYLDL